ncbi:MAG: CPBP family intramembrane glutamic endopeptidase [Chlamydiota bacterium]
MPASTRSVVYWGLVCLCACIAAGPWRHLVFERPAREAPAAALRERAALVPDEAELFRSFEKAAAENPLIGFLSLAFGGVVLAGLLIDARVLLRAVGKRPSWTAGPPGGEWGLSEVLKAALLFLSVFFALDPLARLFRLLPCAPSDVSLQVFFQFVAECAAIVFILTSFSAGLRGGLKKLGLSTGGCRVGVIAGVRAYVGFLPVMIGIVILTRFAAERAGIALEPQTPIGFFFADLSRPALIFLAAFVAVVGPVFEEIFFRGFAYQAIRRRWGRWPGILVTALVFSALHANAAVFLPIFGLGILLACVFEATGSLIPSVTIHICQNSVAAAAALLLRSIARG